LSEPATSNTARTRAPWQIVAVALALGALAVANRPIGARAFAGGANAVVVEDRAGIPLGTVLARDTEHAVRVPLAGVSPRFLAAIVAAEDARFGAHDGVDPLALARATWQFVRTGRVVSGGSTITMQLARLRFGVPRTPVGKLEELVLARRIEAGASKAEILEAYVNRLPMGGDLVGVEAGARTYFGAPARDLDLAHAAFLAALPNDPVRLDPYAHRDALEARRRLVLARMVAGGWITADDAARAAVERIDVQPRNDGIAGAAQLLFRLAGSVAPDATRVRTTIDRDLQAFAENATQQIVGGLSERRVRDGAAIVIDNRDGAIVAYVGSADYFARTGAGKNDGVAALRQPGSTLKPFLYELAFERRVVRPTTILADVPTTYALPGLRAYSPGDYSERFAGPVRPRIALADSLNVPAVRVLSAVGVPSFLDRLRALGFVHLTRDADHYGLGLALGDGEVSLEELAGAYAAIANGGRRVRVHALAGVPDPRGVERVGAMPEWELVTDILADAHARARAFGVASLLRTPFASAVKTGTSSDFRDTWTIGFTRDYTVGTWVGNFDGAPMQRVSGVTGAAPLWNRIVRHLAEREVPAAFAVPHGYVRRAMCATTGVRPTGDCRSVVGEWLDARDLIAWQAPPAALDRAYDAWLAAQPAQAHEPLRIVAPHDGDIFVAAPGARIAVVARGTRRPTWDLNGRAVAARDAHWTLALARGRWTLRAHDAGRIDSVTFTVGDPLPHGRRAGFTIR
jgi:penicillin-binding protein 1C